ncbi:MAG: HEAT repeat domain-containing protein [Timaviella obliquedivisa GSE-PSE-MK23-08B]|nr:HEAT repeat domain-containing protein [Timaviella obliquedivisa GSE-PSE-MK23-08B]
MNAQDLAMHSLPASHRLNQPGLEAAIDLLKGGDFHDRWDAVKIISACGDEAIAPLLPLLQTDDWELQWFIVRILGNLQNPKIIPTLVALIKASHADVASRAAGVLSSFGEIAIAPLAALLDHEPTQLLVMQALAQIHHPQVIPYLLQEIEDADVRAVAIEALGHFHHAPEIPPVLRAALQDRTAAVRRAAVVGLGFQAECHPVDWLHWLQPLLQDVDGEVAQQTAIALGRVGTPAAVAVLNQALLNPALQVSRPGLTVEVIRAIARVGTDLSGLQTYLQTATPTGKQEAIAVLGRVEHLPAKGQAAEILLQLLESQPDVREKQAIAFSLGQLGRIEAMESLIQLLADADASVRFHAIAALKQLEPQAAYQRLAGMADEASSSALQNGVAIALREWGDR